MKPILSSFYSIEHYIDRAADLLRFAAEAISSNRDGTTATPNLASKLNPKRALIVDSDDIVRETAEDMLNLLGFEVGFAGDGPAAIALHQQAVSAGKPYDLVILDIAVAQPSGARLMLKKLRQSNPRLKAIVTSDGFDDPIVKHSADFGFNAAVLKPYEVTTLQRIIAKISNDR